MSDDLTIPLSCYPPEPNPSTDPYEEFHNMYDFIAFAAQAVSATWADEGDEAALVSWWTDDDDHGSGVGIALSTGLDTDTETILSVGFTPDEAEKVARLLTRAAHLARSHQAAIEAGPPA